MQQNGMTHIDNGSRSIAPQTTSLVLGGFTQFLSYTSERGVRPPWGEQTGLKMDSLGSITYV